MTVPASPATETPVTTAASAPSTTTAAGRLHAAPDSGPPRHRVRVRQLFQRASGSYAIILGTTVFLVGFGLVMVLSSSSIESYASSQNAFGDFWRQALFAAVGLPLMLVVSRMPLRFWKRWVGTALLACIVLQLLVFTPLGVAWGGNRNWIAVFGFTLQPSEFLKLAVVLWVAWMLASRPESLVSGRALFWPIVPVAGLAVALVMLGQDLGTTLVIGLSLIGTLYFAGVRLRWLALGIGIGGAAAAGIAFSSPNRLERIQSYVDGAACTDYLGACFQITNATYALANGGWLGTGLGNSVMKWSWLPAMKDDFIFAIVGEELGMIGAIVVIVLFIVLAVGFARLIATSRDRFVRAATGGIMVWVVGQAFMNIAVVLGLLPVLGVPLPFISSGGTALIATLGAIGVVLSFARATAVEAPPQVTVRG